MIQPTKRQKTKITHAGRTIYLNNKELLIALKESNENKKMSDTLAKMLQKLCARYGTKGNFVNYCVDSQTEALTKQGWKTHADITTDDEILSYDIDTKQLTWSAIFDIYRNPTYDGLMHKLTTLGLDALVTPNHKFVSNERGIIPVEDIINNDHIILTGLPVEQSISIHDDYFIELVGWIVANAQFGINPSPNCSISISQQLGPNSDRIRDCLTHCNVIHTEYIKNNSMIFTCTGSTITDIYQSIAPNGVLSSLFITELTQPQRLILVYTIINGDGWITPSNELIYYQTCKLRMDAFLMLCTISGSTTTTTNNTVDCNSPLYQIIIHNKPITSCMAGCINFHDSNYRKIGDRNHEHNVPTVQYQGMIWCPQTEYGTFMCRRNGSIYITGNTYNEDMQSYAMLMLTRTWQSFNAEKGSNPFAFFTQCIKHSFIQYLNQEKRHRNIRDMLIVQQGLSASFGFMEESDQHFVDDEQCYEFHKAAASQLYQYNLLSDESPITRDETGSAIDDTVDFTSNIDDNTELTY
jgi:hypothetical protein